MARHGVSLVTVLLAVVMAGTGAEAAEACSSPEAMSAYSERSTKGKSQELGPFDELTPDELTAVYDYVLAQPDLNLTSHADNATLYDNKVYMIELIAPPKDEVLAYLDEGGPMPAREALVIVIAGATVPPEVVEYKVGPLPKPASHEKLRSFDFHARPMSGAEWGEIERVQLAVAEKLQPLMIASFDGWSYYDGCEEQCLYHYDAPQSLALTGERWTWSWWTFNLPGKELHPVGLNILLNLTGRPEDWSATKVYYAGVVYDSADALMEGWNAGTIPTVNISAPVFKGLRDNYAVFNQHEGEARPVGGPQLGAQHYEPQGKRYSVEGNEVEYMGWKVHVGHRPTQGFRLFDFRFKGERVMYELSMNEIIASYGGLGPTQATTHYYDAYWQMGQMSFELAHGVDCPLTATYLNYTYIYDSDEVATNPHSICIFEQDGAMPANRHTEWHGADSERMFAGAPLKYLVIRNIATVYNYDYVLDVHLHINGAIEMEARTTGYLQADVVPDIDEETGEFYGYPYYNNGGTKIGGTIHDHIISFKVDVDIVNSSNTLVVDKVELDAREVDWGFSKPGQLQYTKKLVQEVVESEDDAAFVIDPTKPKVFAIINEEAPNSWGTPRGYRLSVNTPFYQILPPDAPQNVGADWTKYNLAVTKRKDSEPSVSDIYLGAQPDLDTDRSLSKFMDGEAIRGEDLVAWVGIGLYHLPISEDAPSVNIGANKLSFTLKPYNFNDGDAIRDTSDVVVIKHDADPGEMEVTAEEQQDALSAANCVPELKPVEFTYTP
jgi:Cu2+-containing amine oxidase